MQVVIAFVFALLGLLQLAASTETLQRPSVLTGAPSVRLRVMMKREKMRLHGTLSFDVYATPVISANGASVLYDGYATFLDNGSEITYTLANGAAYLTTKDTSGVETVGCLSPNALPFDRILPALNDVSRIPSASIGEEAVKCPEGNLFKTSFVGVHYAICVSGEAGFTAFSSDLDIAVEYLDRQERIQEPKLSDGRSSCKPVAPATLMTPTALSLMRGSNLMSSTTRGLKAESHMAMQATECQQTSKRRPCIIFHGLGNPHERTELQNTPDLVRDRIGNINAPFCSSVKYAVINTADVGWRDDMLQQKYCNFSLSLSASSDVAAGIIDNAIIVTHSMGGLVMASALANGKCSFSPNTSCLRGKKDAIAEGLFGLLGQCPLMPSRGTTVYQGEKYSTPAINEAYAAAQKAYRDNVAAAICSDSYYGVFSKYQAPSVIAAKVVSHKSSKNDGLVEYRSCLGGLDDAIFGDHYLNRFYRSKLNHADTAFMTGDGIFKDSQKPTKWFQCLAL
uniref:Uncharacterized protein n=1 Tax=Peronospora matthiolae TaxID=2874970 RepID=A0AAV1UT15_9STRA